MSKGPRLETERLILRRWTPEDLDPFAAINADPAVMEFLLPTNREQTEAGIKRMEHGFETDGFSFWAAELRETAELVGMIGLKVPSFEAHFTPCVEIGWRLARRHWGKGLALEGSKASLNWGFEVLALPEIVAYTVVGNVRSRRVMERLGMSYDPRGDFDHPKVPDGHPLKRHVLYRIKRPR